MGIYWTKLHRVVLSSLFVVATSASMLFCMPLKKAEAFYPTVGAAPQEKRVTITGTVTYTHYGLSPVHGINYNAPTEKPIRGAVAVLQNSKGIVLEMTNTTQTGGYAFNAPANSTVRIIVKAALGLPDTPHVKVVDNTNDGTLYEMFFDVRMGMSKLTANFNANSDWDGAHYLGERTAAPFTILDTIYQAEALIKHVDPAVQFPALTVNWSTKNKPVQGDITLGEIGPAHYSMDNLFLAGAEDIDTDEYDAHVIAHEWGHYFTDKFGRSDSVGGRHNPENRLDPRVSFSEGWANALSGMILNDPVYISTSGLLQSKPFVFKIDQDAVLDSKTDRNGFPIEGFYSEASIHEVLYDLFDSGVPDDDNISLGFKPIYDVMVGGQKTAPAYTTIFSFLKYLKDANPTDRVAISALAAAENIAPGDEYEAFSGPIYTTVPVDGTMVTTGVDGLPLQTRDINGPMTATHSGNKLFNQVFFRFKIVTAGTHTIKVVPTDGGDLLFIWNEGITEAYMASRTGVGGTETTTRPFMPGDYRIAVSSFSGPATFTISIN